MNRRLKRTPSKPRPADVTDTMTAAYWELPGGPQTVSLANVLRTLPSTVRFLLGTAWVAGRAAVLLLFTLESGASVLTAWTVLAAANLLARTATLVRLDGPLTGAAREALWCAGLLFLGRLTQSGADWLQAALKPSVKKAAEDRLYHAVVHTDLTAYDDPAFYDAMSRAQTIGVNYVGMAMDRMLDITRSSLSLLAATGALAVLHPVLLPMLLLSGVPTGWAAVRSANVMHQSTRRFAALRRRMLALGRLMADRDTAAEIRACSAHSTLLEERERLAGLARAEETRVGRAEVRTTALGQALSGGAAGLSYAALFLLLYAGVAAPAVLGGAAVAIQTGQNAVRRLTAAASKLFEQGLYVQDYCDFIRDAESRRRAHRTGVAPGDFEEISLHRATFTYPGQTSPALSEVSITVRRGQVIALVGENGSGKSTLAKVIAGLYVPQSGAVRWGGTDLTTVDELSVYRQVAFVMQAPARWPFTARANITIGRPERADPGGSALESAAALSTADDVVIRLPDGYETLLSKEFQRGVDLSGGEWQRFAVARAFYRDAPLLICDEPSAAMDARAERRVFRTLRALSGGRTTVLITHRLSGVRDADRIFFLHRGRVVEQGTHEELMAVGGRYRDLYDIQAEAVGLSFAHETSKEQL